MADRDRDDTVLPGVPAEPEPQNTAAFPDGDDPSADDTVAQAYPHALRRIPDSPATDEPTAFPDLDDPALDDTIADAYPHALRHVPADELNPGEVFLRRLLARGQQARADAAAEPTRPLSELPPPLHTPSLDPAELVAPEAPEPDGATAADEAADEAAAPSRRRFRRRYAVGGLLTVIVGVLVLCCLVVLVDAAARASAQGTIQDKLKAQLGDNVHPVVHIAGTPFLTQAMDHRYPHVTVSAPGARLQGLDFSRFDFTVNNLKTTADNKSGTIESLSGDTTITYSSIGAKQGLKLEYVSPTELRASFPAKVLTFTVTIVVTGRPELDVGAQNVTLKDIKTRVDSVGVPDILVRQAATFVVKPVSLPMPSGMKVTAIRLAPDGLQADVTGQNIDLDALK